MFFKRLTGVGLSLCIGALFGSTVVFAQELGDVQKRIQDRNLKWVADDVPNAENRGLGLLKDGFTMDFPAADLGAEALTATLPTSLDWRNVGAGNLLGVLPGNYVSKIKNQSSCGSCWAFATTAIAESTLQIAMNEPIDGVPADDALNLSEQVMLNCSDAGSCNGGYVTYASSYISTTGLLRENPSGCYSYNYGSTTCPNPTASPTCDQTRYRIDGWSGVSANVDAMKNALNTYGPLVTTYAVYNDFYRYYSSGVYAATSCDQSVNPLIGYHAVALVGYHDADATTPEGYFIVKNSWGTSWGETAGGTERGYFRIAYSQVGNCVGFGGSTIAYRKNACNGDITVLSPAHSTTLQAGETQAITWDAVGSIGQYVKIDLLKNGVFVRTLQTNAPLATESYTWTVDSDLSGEGYTIVVTSTSCSSASGTSGPFTILGSQSFNVSGDVTASGAALSGVTMTFTRISGTGAIPAAVQTESSGFWTQTGFKAGTTYRATPSKTGCRFTPAYLDFTSSNTTLDFTLVESKITSVLSPGSGASWKAGNPYPITWTYTGTPGTYVSIQWVNMTTGAKKTIISRARVGSGGAGTYTWKISRLQAAGSYQIVVKSTTNGTSATSATFDIIK